MMKKLLSSILAISFLLSNTAVFAENSTEELESLLVSVKNRIGDTDHFSEFNSNSRSSDSGTVYNFSWHDYNVDYPTTLYVTCNSEGVITSYSYHDPQPQKEKNFLSINGTKRAEALRIAKEAVKNLNPDIAESLLVFDDSAFESFRNNSYNFRIQRYENGIPVLSDTGGVTLNSDCSLYNFYMTYTPGFTFENAENLIEKDMAKYNYTQKIGADLYYMTHYDESDQPEIRLAYTPKSDNRYIHAVTGDVVDIAPVTNIYSSYASKENYAMDSAGGSNFRGQLSDAELKTVLEVEDLLSKEEADKIIRECRYFAIPHDAILENASTYYNETLKTYVYNFSYDLNTTYANIIINAKNGEILFFIKPSDISQNAEADPKKIKTLAKEIMEEFSKDKAHEFRPNDSDDAPTFDISYTRYINDIPFYENTALIAFDEDYNLKIYDVNYYDLFFPEPENIISSETASDILDTLGDYKLYYIGDHKSDKFIPLYSFTEKHTIDAFTGKSFYEAATSDEKANYTDIDGHYAEDKIKELASYGIFLDGSELKPDDPITQKDYAALLSILFGSGGISILRSTVNTETIYKSFPITLFSKDEINPTAHLTRSTAARLMVKAMGAEEYAELSSIYAPLYKDVTEDIGYINILTGLNVVSGDGAGNFNPQKEITKAQALIMIYNYLSR